MNKRFLKVFLVTMITILLQASTKCAEFELSELYMGNISISDTNIDVPLYYTNDSWMGVNQEIVDQDNAAVYQDGSDFYECMPLIADHRNQNNFSELYDVTPDVSIACITDPNGNQEHYICREIDRNSVNDGMDILDSAGNLASTKYPSNWIAIYTCNLEGYWTVTLTFWEPLVQWQQPSK